MRVLHNRLLLRKVGKRKPADRIDGAHINHTSVRQNKCDSYSVVFDLTTQQIWLSIFISILAFL
jgi:hypothetical protein